MAITGIPNGALSRLVGQSALLKAQLETLSAQSVDGRRGTYYGEIAGDAGRAISLRAEIARRDTHAVTIDRALGRTGAAQEALERLSTIAEQFLTEAGKITRADSTRITALAGSAREAIQEVAALLNEKHAGEFIFGGADIANPPIPDPAGIMGTPMAAAIASATASLAPGNSATVLAATLAAAQSTNAGETPFSDYAVDPGRGLTEPRTGTAVGDGEVVRTGLFASRNAAAGTAGSEAGGWSRDLLRGLMTLASLTADKTAAGGDFDAVMESVKAGLKSAMTGLGEEAGALGQSEARLEAARTRHADLKVTLSGQLADVEEVDLAATLVAMQDTQTRLQASWQALSMLSGLSLTQFLR
ncbi:flagellin [Roseomonas xinghualingensis]|uniref:flagellin n=1 Tax=Roseomonas xinghualingensis TaxID=2986475 RepID=UPI0021F0AFC9|nr:flagellin [Roseomonas sp. SXEYE001]MCV4207512.1 flagellin [Roseomonas sp. SXEYE001]